MYTIVGSSEEAVKLTKEVRDQVIVVGAGIGDMAPDMEISFFYDKDNYMSGRGYYISVTPVNLKDGLPTHLVSYGRRKMISPNEVKRKSKGNEDKARKNFDIRDVIHVIKDIHYSKARRDVILAEM